MILSVTTSSNLTNKISWSGIQHEHDTDKIHKKNPYLNTAESKRLRAFNLQGTLVNYDKYQDDFCSEYVKQHDQKQTHQNRKYGSVASFLNRSKGQPYDLYIGKFADMDSWNKWKNYAIDKVAKTRQITQRQAESAVYTTVAYGLYDYLQKFNERHQDQKITNYRIDMDEKGSPHFHSRLVSHSLTKSGRPSLSINNALKAKYGVSGTNAQHLSKWRYIEDKQKFEAVNNAIQQNLPELQDMQFKFIRRTDQNPKIQTGQNHDIYKIKAQHAEMANNQRTINAQTKTIAKLTLDTANQKSINDGLKDTKSQLEDDITELQPKRNSLVDDIKKKQDEAKQADLEAQQAKIKADQQEKQEKARVDQNLQNYINRINQEQAKKNKQREQQLNNWQTELYQKSNGLTQREQAVSKREKDVSQREQSARITDHNLELREQDYNKRADNVAKREQNVTNAENSLVNTTARFLVGFHLGSYAYEQGYNHLNEIPPEKAKEQANKFANAYDWQHHPLATFKQEFTNCESRPLKIVRGLKFAFKNTFSDNADDLDQSFTKLEQDLTQDDDSTPNI